MKYQDYIDLGFKRHEMNDNVELRNTGYTGYSLEKRINKKIMICVYFTELDNPKLYIKKSNKDEYHIVNINTEIVIDLLK